MSIVQAAGFSVRASDGTDKPAIVLLRMASRDAGLWDTIWHPLEQWFRVVQFDLPMPSFDALDDPREAFGTLAADVRDVMSALGHRSYSVFGWNGGCHVALRCAADSPDDIQQCILLGPFHTVRDRRPLDQGLRFLQALFERRDARTYTYYWYMSGLSPKFCTERFDRIQRWVEQRLAHDRFVAQDSKRAMKWMHALRDAWLSDGELRSILTSTLILAPTLNQWHAGPTLEMAQTLAALMPHSQLVTLDGSGSLILLEDPERVIVPLSSFIKRRLHETLDT